MANTLLPFPKSGNGKTAQQVMTEYQKKKASGEYAFTGGKWYSVGQTTQPSVVSQTPTQPTKPVVQQPVQPIQSTPAQGITIPKGEAAKGKQVTIGGKLYPSQEWYDVNVAGKQEATSTPAPSSSMNWSSLYNTYSQKANQQNWDWFWIGSNTNTADRRYYRKENGQWIQRGSEAEAKQRFTSIPESTEFLENLYKKLAGIRGRELNSVEKKSIANEVATKGEAIASVWEDELRQQHDDELANTKSTAYTIKSGDTLSALAQKYGTTVDALMEANPNISNRDEISAGASLNIPGTQTQDTQGGQVNQGYQPITTPEQANTAQEEIERLRGILDRAKEAGITKGEIPEDILDVDKTSDIISSSGDKDDQEKLDKAQELEDYLNSIGDDKQEVERLTVKQQLKTLREELGLDADGNEIDKPGVPTFEDDFSALRSEQGVAALESRLNTLDTTIADKEAALRQGMYSVEGELKPMELIGTEQRELQRQAYEEIDALNRSKNTIIGELNTKNALISQMMSLKQLDYNTASDDYNKSFTQQIQLLNIVEGREDKADQEENAQQDDARANLNVLLGLTGDQTWDTMDAGLQAQLSSLATKAGLPSGMIQQILNNVDSTKTLKTTITSQDKTRISFVYTDGSVSTFDTGLTAGASTTAQPTSYKEWELAGGKVGTGYDFGPWLDRKTGDDEEEDNQKIIDNFNKALKAPKDEDISDDGFREKLILKLRKQYPEIDPDDIAKKVYEYYTEEYINGINY